MQEVLSTHNKETKFIESKDLCLVSIFINIINRNDPILQIIIVHQIISIYFDYSFVKFI